MQLRGRRWDISTPHWLYGAGYVGGTSVDISSSALGSPPHLQTNSVIPFTHRICWRRRTKDDDLLDDSVIIAIVFRKSKYCQKTFMALPRKVVEEKESVILI